MVSYCYKYIQDITSNPVSESFYLMQWIIIAFKLIVTTIDSNISIDAIFT